MTQATKSSPSTSAQVSEKVLKAKKEKKAKVKLPKYQIPESGLTTVPKDFDPAKFARLSRKDFAEDFNFFEFRADQMEKDAKELRAKAKLQRSLGSSEQRKALNSFVKGTKKLEELKARLLAEGVDLNAALQS